MLHALAQLHRGVDHKRVEQEDQQRQLPVHPHQNGRRAENRQHGHQQTAERIADELVDGLQISDQVRRYRAAAEAFVFGQGNALEPLDQAHANAVHDVLRQPSEQTRLQHVEHQRRRPQYQSHAEHEPDIADRGFPAGWQESIHDLQRRVARSEQYLVDQQRQ